MAGLRSRVAAEITVGSRVSVFEGRHFQDFGAGDQGVVVSLDADGQTCEVAFDGRPGRQAPLSVARRHLCLERRPSEGEAASTPRQRSRRQEPPDTMWDAIQEAFATAGAGPSSAPRSALASSAPSLASVGPKRLVEVSAEQAESSHFQAEFSGGLSRQQRPSPPISSPRAATASRSAATELHRAAEAAALAEYCEDALASLSVHPANERRAQGSSSHRSPGVASLSAASALEADALDDALQAAEIEQRVAGDRRLEDRVKAISSELGDHLQSTFHQELRVFGARLDGLDERCKAFSLLAAETSQHLEESFASRSCTKSMEARLEELAAAVSRLHRELDGKAPLRQMEDLAKTTTKSMNDMLSQWERRLETRRRALLLESDAVSGEISRASELGSGEASRSKDDVAHNRLDSLSNRLEANLRETQRVQLRLDELVQLQESSTRAVRGCDEASRLDELARAQAQLLERVDALQAEQITHASQPRLEDMVQTRASAAASAAASMLSQQWESKFDLLNARAEVLRQRVDELSRSQ
ncbi:unnamed protein product, partial [Polarella glacialis]